MAVHGRTLVSVEGAGWQYAGSINTRNNSVPSTIKRTPLITNHTQPQLPTAAATRQHPLKFRTEMCRKGPLCDRRLCFFAHRCVRARGEGA